jgi:hypothetical protein
MYIYTKLNFDGFEAPKPEPPPVKVTPHRRAAIGENRCPHYQKLSEIRKLAAISKRIIEKGPGW